MFTGGNKIVICNRDCVLLFPLCHKKLHQISLSDTKHIAKHSPFVCVVSHICLIKFVPVAAFYNFPVRPLLFAICNLPLLYA